MAYSDLCHISNAYKDLENEVDQSDRIMEENAMVRDLITKILDESGEGSSSIPQPPPQEKSINSIPPSQFLKNDAGPSFMPSSSSFPYDSNFFNFHENEYNFIGQNGFNTNGYFNFPDDTNSLLTFDPISEDTVTPEQLNLLRLAAQEIGGAQFQSPKQFDEKYYNFFEPNQRNSLPETNMYPPTFTRPNSLNIDTNYSNYENQYNQRLPNKFENGFMKDQNQDSTDLLAYLNQLTLSGERPRDDLLSNDFKMPVDMSGAFQENFNKMQEERNRLFFNGRNFQQGPIKYNGDFYSNDVMPQSDRNLGHNYDFSHPPNSMGYKPNGYHQQNDFGQRRDINPGMPREGFPNNMDRVNFENFVRENQQQLLRHQELAIQMSMFIRTMPPPNPLNVDVSFLHENTPFNIGLGAILGPSPQYVPPPVLPSPVLDIPVLAPFYTISDMRTASTSSSILHSRLDDCYEQWRQLERERKRTEARLALAYPGKAVSSSNSIPVPRLPPCPTRVDRLTVDMLREHTKVLTLMGKMETLRASVCVAQNKKPNKVEDGKITVLRRGQEKITLKELDPATFDPASWKEDVKNMTDIAPHVEVENAMLAWRNAVAGVQAARRKELAAHASSRYTRTDPILQLAAAVKQLCVCARRARAAMWSDLTLTVALAPHHSVQQTTGNSQPIPAQSSPKQSSQEPTPGTSSAKPTVQQKEEKPSTDNQTKNETKQEDAKNKEKNRRSQNYRRVNRNDYYMKNQRYDNRFVRHPYHYLATGPIN